MKVRTDDIRAIHQRVCTAFLAAAAMLVTLLAAPAAAQGLDGATRIRAFSTASGHEPVEYGVAGESSAILIDDAVVRQPIVPAGLRVAVAQKDGLTRSAFFRLADRPGEVEKLAQFIEAVAPGEALVMVVHRSIAPAAAPPAPDGVALTAERDRLAALMRRLGAEAAPIDRAGVSWGFIGLRLDEPGHEEGTPWVRLAESVSASRGVSVAFVLGTDQRRYLDYPSRLISDGPTALRLMERWPTLKPMPDTAIFGSIQIGGRELPAILAHPPYRAEVLAEHPDGENRLPFEGVRLGKSPRFECAIGLGDEAHGESDGATFSLVVDGQVVASRTVTAAAEEPPAWHDWTVDLAPWAGETVTLELRTGPNGSTLFDHAHWGNPLAVSGDAPAESALDPDDHRLVFVGHAYPMSGFDKRSRPSYLGWDTADGTYSAHGRSVRRRVQIERWPAARSAFEDAIRAVHAERLIWGGDCMYTPGSAESAYLAERLASFGEGQVVLPGNHDFPLAADPAVLQRCAAAAGQDETVAGVRLLYVDSIRSGDRIIVDDASACAPDRAWIDALQGRLAAAAADPGIYGLVLMLHHAAWITEPGVANVAHSDDWWGREIHPALQALAEAGISVVVIAGDAGDHCMADGRRLDGVTYVVTGQPRFDSDVPNGFVEVGWGPSRPGLAVRVHTWTWGREPEVFEPQSDSWRY